MVTYTPDTKINNYSRHVFSARNLSLQFTIAEESPCDERRTRMKKKDIALIVMQYSGCEQTVPICVHMEDFLWCLSVNVTVQLE